MPSILIVEDEASLAEALRMQFVKESFKVYVAKDGEAAVEQALAEHPDVILLDILLPKKSGLDALDELRRDAAWGKKVPIIILTNLPPDKTNFDRATKAGVDNFLLKSEVGLGQIVFKVKRLLELSSNE